MPTSFVVRRLRGAPHHRVPRVQRKHARIRKALVLVSGIVASLALATPALGQASPTASRLGDLQAGAGFSFGTSNYLTPALGGHGESLRGFDLYSSLDFKHHFGAEIDFRQTAPSYGRSVYERTYEIGGRYFYPIGHLKPYARAMYGRGVFNYPYGAANLAYNLVGLGAGIDYGLFRSVNVRADYEYQRWFGFPLNPLQPSVVTIGVAYHISSRAKCPLCANR